MSGTAPGPLSTKHIFLYEIAKQPDATKVRFLGCVTSYDVPTAILVLEHAFPAKASKIPLVKVDVNLILESIQAQDLRKGTWLNVIGYVRKKPVPRRTSRKRSVGTLEPAEQSEIQALVAWNAGALKVEDYEMVLTQRQGMTA